MYWIREKRSVDCNLGNSMLGYPLEIKKRSTSICGKSRQVKVAVSELDRVIEPCPRGEKSVLPPGSIKLWVLFPRES